MTEGSAPTSHDERSPVQVGEILAGKYRIDRVLGAGGMGVVVQATHITLNDKVALKFLLPQMLGNKVVVDRFLREAQAAVKIKSPHVARVTDVGTLESGSPFMVMEFLEGRDIAVVLAEKKPLPIVTAVTWALEACEALAAAHAAGIVHRDIKPGNLFITTGPDQQPLVKMLDFGISKSTDADAPGSMTRTHATMGSPLYMSPEQMRSSKHVDSRTDIWSLGVVLYEMLVGKVPFIAESLPELCAIVLDKENLPPSLREARPEIPEELEAAVLGCLAKDRETRFADMAEVAHALAPFAGEHGAHSALRCHRILEGAGLRTAGASVVVLAGPESISPRSRGAITGAPVSIRPPPPGTAAPPLLPAKEADSNKEAVTVATGIRSDTATSFGGTDAGTRKPNRMALGALLGAGAAVIAAVVGLKMMSGGGPDGGARPAQTGEVAAISAAPIATTASTTTASPAAPSATYAASAEAVASASAAPTASAAAAPVITPASATIARPMPTARPSTPTKKPGGSVFDDRQ